MGKKISKYELAEIEDTYFKVLFILEKDFPEKVILFDKYDSILDIVTDIIISPEKMAFEVEALTLMNYLYEKMLSEFSDILKNEFDYSEFSLWKDNKIKQQIFF